MQAGIEKLPHRARIALKTYRNKLLAKDGNREEYENLLREISITDSYYRQIMSGYYSPSIKVVMRLIQYKVISFSDLEGWYYV